MSSVNKKLLELLPLANPNQDVRNTLKLKDFSGGGPWRTTIWQKGTYATIDDMATLEGIKCNGKYYAFASPVSLSNGYNSALVDAVKQVFSDNSEELGGVEIDLVSGPNKAKSMDIVAGATFETFMVDANTEFAGFVRSSSPYYVVNILKATPKPINTYVIRTKNVTGGSNVVSGLYLGFFSGNIANGPYSYSGDSATDANTAISIKNDIEALINSFSSDSSFVDTLKPETPPTCDAVDVKFVWSF